MSKTLWQVTIVFGLIFQCLPVFGAEGGQTKFCLKIDDQYNPIEPATEFDTNQVSCLFVNGNEDSFKVLEAVVSIYNDSVEGVQELLHREEVAVNPDWNVLILQDIPLPSTGKYSFVLSSKEGKVFSSGTVTIKEKKVDTEMAEKNTVTGTNLKLLYDKFKSLAK
ncbi:MAG: hypothetical protein LBP22_07120 [Deltaproteobacteria bacterium]|jgi:hypothetical protein|nr:hypothetical protein [Deltaproteobacteria bacterium]